MSTLPEHAVLGEPCLAPGPGGVCGRRAVAYDAAKRRPVCKPHAPWYPAKLGPPPGVVNPSPCCGRTLVPVYSNPSRQESVLTWERCPLCKTVWDLGG